MKGDPFWVSLQDILFIIGIEERTGELVLESGNNIGTIIFHRGNILQAFSPYSRAIGDLLVEDGLISESDLMETLKLQKQNVYAPLGGLLLKTGKVTFEVIEMLVHEQIRDAVKEFNGWGEFKPSFVVKDIRPFDTISTSVDQFLGTEFMGAAVRFLTRAAALPPAHPASGKK